MSGHALVRRASGLDVAPLQPVLPAKTSTDKKARLAPVFEFAQPIRSPASARSGSLSWGGINNTFFWIDPARGIAGVIMMQVLPFADAKALAIYEEPATDKKIICMREAQEGSANLPRLGPIRSLRLKTAFSNLQP
jgi:CubicO group peptidase (beta-lactamase class C family)